MTCTPRPTQKALFNRAAISSTATPLFLRLVATTLLTIGAPNIKNVIRSKGDASSSDQRLNVQAPPNQHHRHYKNVPTGVQGVVHGAGSLRGHGAGVAVGVHNDKRPGNEHEVDLTKQRPVQRYGLACRGLVVRRFVYTTVVNGHNNNPSRHDQHTRHEN
jgi:hypothetical protein